MRLEDKRTGALAEADGIVADEVLVSLIGDGDQAAMSMFYKIKSKLIYSVVLNIVKDIADAEEITGDVFLRIWEKARTFDRSRGSVMAWITTIARRQAIDKTRSKGYRGKEKELSLDAAGDHGAEMADASKDGNAASGLQARVIEEALNQLSDSHRQLIRLSYYEGLSHSMIAESLNTPLGTVKTRIREAVSQLRGILNVKA